MLEINSDHVSDTEPANPPSQRRNLWLKVRGWLFKVFLIFLSSSLTIWLFPERMAHFYGLVANLNPLELFFTYIDNLFRHFAGAETYCAKALKGFPILAKLCFLAKPLALIVTPFTALYVAILEIFHKFQHNPFNAVYAGLELLIGGLIALPGRNYHNPPMWFVRVLKMIVAGSLFGGLFYAIIWIFGKGLGLLISLSMAIPYAEELLKSAVEERVHWSIALLVGRKIHA